MNIINELSKLNTHNWQKICAAEDWSKPEFKFVLEKIFKSNASYHRKQWEFVTIFLCLSQQGKLNQNSIGASFGAGKEPLIYHLLPYVKSFLATDLYSWNTGWDTAKMGKKDTPMDFLKRNAPKATDLSNLQAEEMDMRTLDIEDNSLDFCYSSCAVEHIGDHADFVQHLKEVKRVLKPDGIYVMTTEFLFNHQTVANKGNYKFDNEYLKKLFIESGLDTQMEFDAGCEESRLNVPRAYVRPLIGGKNIEKLLASAAILDIEGVAYTSCCFILSPAQGDTVKSYQTNGLSQSSKFTKKKVYKNMLHLFTDKRSIDPFYSLNKNSRLFLDDHMKFRVESKNDNRLIKLDRANFCFTDYIYFEDHHASFTISYELSEYKGKVNWFLVEKDSFQIKGKTRKKSLMVKHKQDDSSHNISFDFVAEPHKVYAIIGQIPPKNFDSNMLELSIKNLNVFAQLVK
ncbi:MAG: class I SAM-dependent methyltransferase [Marinicellaceae bacterium]